MDIASAIAHGARFQTFINKVRELLGKNKNAIIVPTGEDAKDIIDAIRSKNTDGTENIEITKFKGEFTWITVNDRTTGLTSKENCKKLIRESAKPKPQIAQRINILPENVGEEYTQFKNEEKPLFKKVYNLLPKLNNKYKALISLSIQVERFYEEGRDAEASSVKVDANREWDDGAKFISLWTVGYLKTIFDFISLPENITSEELNSLLDSFIEKSHSIFFIHQATEKDEVIESINQLLKKKESYVAIHSLGFNNSKCKNIIKTITLDISPEYIQKDIMIKKRCGTSIDNVRGVGKIWYKGKDGLDIYKLIEPYI